VTSINRRWRPQLCRLRNAFTLEVEVERVSVVFMKRVLARNRYASITLSLRRCPAHKAIGGSYSSWWAGLTGNVRRAAHITDFEHLVGQHHLGVSQSNDAIRISPPSSRLTDSVVLSVASKFSRTFSTKNPQVYSNYCLSVMLLSALRRTLTACACHAANGLQATVVAWPARPRHARRRRAAGAWS
jgi:hypothetical protein